MSQETEDGQKTQEPTEKRLMDARKKGDVPMSREAANMTVVMSLLGIVALVLPWQVPNLVDALSGLIANAGNTPVGTGGPGLVMLGQVINEFVLNIVMTLTPLFLLLLVGALIGVVIQGETVISFERIQPKLSKISPREGLKRQFSANAIVELVKNLAKVLIVGALALWVTDLSVRQIWEGNGFLPEHLPSYITDSSQKLLIAVAALMVPISIADILWRRFEWRRKQMMSHKEIRDEVKESEGSPEIRAKRAQLRRTMSRQRVAAAVPKADVILTNPTHFAVALKYDIETDPAPICVAKGADNVARKIREIAFEHEIPVIENKPLARMLHDTIDVDAMVPVEHWEVVAEIISFVMDLRKNVDRDLPDGSRLRGPDEE